MVRYLWSLLIVLLLAGCGQPLQINPTAAAGSARTPAQGVPRPTSVPVPRTATIVPGDSSPAPEGPSDYAAATAALPQSTPSTPVAPPTPTPAVIVIPQTAASLDREQRWRAQELDRQVLTPPQLYIAKNPVPLLWYDPITGQSLEIGTLIGTFPVQARFRLRSSNSPALEVPYRINNDFGLTSISEAVRDRIAKAGYAESVEAYVIQTNDVVPK